LILIEKKYYPHYISNKKLLRLSFLLILYFSSSTILTHASGAYDNGTATGKGRIGLDLTWNPFNYFPNGQTYAVISYGINNYFDIHGYFSIPTKGSENYYIGFFYQFFKHNNLDLSTAIGTRQYVRRSDQHLFAPQLLFTFHYPKIFSIGGSIVNIRNIDKIYKVIGTTIDLSVIVPIYRSKTLSNRVNSIDFTIGAFRPILWRPEKSPWHPTYSFDIKFKL